MSIPARYETEWKVLSNTRIRILIGIFLSFSAGIVNSISTQTILFERSSHVSGRISDIGMNLVLFPIDALLVAIIWLAFIFGAFLGGKIMARLGFTAGLFLIAGLIAVGSFLVLGGLYAKSPDDYGLARMIIAFILPLAMGFQNSLTTQTSLGRTTHWTGDSTDIGIALAESNFPVAIYNLIKIGGFILGAAFAAYLITFSGLVQSYSLLLFSSGFIIAVAVFLRLCK